MLWTLSRFPLRRVGEMLCIPWVKQTASYLKKKNLNLEKSCGYLVLLAITSSPAKKVSCPVLMANSLTEATKPFCRFSWPTLFPTSKYHWLYTLGTWKVWPCTDGTQLKLLRRKSCWSGHPLPNIRGCVTKTLVELEREYPRLRSAFRLLKRIRSH